MFKEIWVKAIEEKNQRTLDTTTCPKLYERPANRDWLNQISTFLKVEKLVVKPI